LNAVQNCSNTALGGCTARSSWALAGSAPEAVGLPPCGREGYLSPCVEFAPDFICTSFSGGPLTRACR
jgi:hypothetical protein